MIYTITLNPSLDYTIRMEHFRLGSLNRTDAERISPGGKGVNVSMMLANLGCPNTALGFLAGFTGEESERKLQRKGIQTKFIYIEEGFSRINVKILAQGQETGIQETELNGRGPRVGESELEALFACLNQIQKGDILVLAGSVPTGLPDTIYQDICRKLSGKGVHIVVDAAGSLLKKVLPYHPFLMKPNGQELGELFDVELHTREEAIPYARKLQELGAGNVLVSLGEEGAVLLEETGSVYESPAPKGNVVNTVGAGDSMVAGFLAGFLKTWNYREAFFTGLCAGSASAFSEELATAECVEQVRCILEE